MSEQGNLAVVVMGVSGSGKTVVGSRLAASLAATFIDADHLHPSSNIEKMSSGIPLDDQDREPWLVQVGEVMSRARRDGSVVVACSSLRQRYRATITRHARSSVVFVHLTGDATLLEHRLGHRDDHFTPRGLLASQLDTLEPLLDSETGFVVDISPPIEQILHRIIDELHTNAASPSRKKNHDHRQSRSHRHQP